MIERRYSFSRINKFIKCQRKYQLHYLMRIRPAFKAAPLVAGGAVARALEMYRETNDYDMSVKALLADSQQSETPLMLLKKDDPLRSVERLFEIFNEYCKEYPNEAQLMLKPSKEAKSCEVKFELELTDIPLDIPLQLNVRRFYTGRIDGIINLADGTPALLEDKTTTRLGPSFFKALSCSSQILWYLWAATKLGLFDIGKSSAPKCLMNVLYIHKEKYRFERDITIKAKATLDAAYLNMLQWIYKIEHAEEVGIFCYNNEACNDYGGCEYTMLKDVEEGSKFWNRIVSNNFVVKDKEDK